MSEWIKLYTDILDDPKMVQLTWEECGTWMMLLLLASDLEHRDADGNPTGRVDTLEHVAWHLERSVAELAPAVEKLLQLDLLHRDADGVLYVTDFAQYLPDEDEEIF